MPALPEMALPAVSTFAECADFGRTVAPFLADLSTLPFKLTTDTSALKELYLTTNPLTSALTFALAPFPIFFIVSEVNKNYSQVDRVWSILPAVFNVHYAVWARLNGWPTQKVDNAMAFSVIWSLRLTFNYWRKGGYEVGSEDYRWEIIKKYIGPIPFLLLNIFFISSLQIILLLAVTTPTYIILLTSLLQPTPTATSIAFPRFILALVVFEYFADQQQWDFHAAKAAYASTAKVPQGWSRAQMDRGFLTAGLWRWSRHPNFAGEQAVWFTLYLWAAYESGQWWNWTVGGVLGYMAVFQGSTPITEWISMSKYPEYRLYRERVGQFLPAFGKGWDEAEMAREGPKLLEQRKREGKKGGKIEDEAVRIIKQLR